MNEQRRTVLVVGATGSIGRFVVASAVDHGFAVRVLVRDAHRASFPPDVEVAVGDLTRPETLSQAVAGIEISHRLPPLFAIPFAGCIVDCLSALAKTLISSSNEMPCFARLARALASPNSNLIGVSIWPTLRPYRILSPK
jgi:NAD(P)-dependent dehydrogenase (short-subunit alcohol dehydrogenase family)